MQQRLQYIDEIKGFAIFFVVVGHIFEWSFCSYETGYLSPFHGLIYTFHMPLFAFVSGFLMNTSFSWKSFRKRAERLLLPMLTVGLTYAYWRGWDAMTFFTSQYKIGYWYLLVLFLAWVLSCFYQIITNISCKWKFLIDIVMSLIFITCIYICEKLMPEHINNLLSFSYMSYLLPYIFSGIIIKRHKLFDSLFGNDRLYNIVLFFLGGALIMCYALNHGKVKMVMAPLFIYVIVYLFYTYKDKQNKVKVFFAGCGRSSLSIYMFHYFFIHSCYCKFFQGGGMPFVELSAAIILAIIICICCLALEQLIRTSKILRYLLIGGV